MRRTAFALLCLAVGLAQAAEPSIAANNAHVLVSRSDGAVAGWGSDLYGKLATGRPLLRSSPAQITGMPPITQVASYAYGFHFVARDANGRVWSWGQNDSAQLGPRVQRNASLPGRVQGLSGVAQVAASEAASLALKSDGTVWVWGLAPFTGRAFDILAVPTKIDSLTGIVQISAGEFHFFARKSDGTLWAAGWNVQNQLGNGSPSPVWDQYATPIQVPVPGNVVDVVASTIGGAARTDDGKVWSWGATDFNEAGQALPRQVTGFPATPTKLVGGGLIHHAVLPDGSLWSWTSSTPPQKVNGFSSVRAMSADFDYTVVDTLGRMFVRSGNAYGERGLGPIGPTDVSTITQVPSPTNFVDVRLTQHCVIGVTANGEVWAWGGELSGSFGDGIVQTYAVPKPIAGISNIVQVAAGQDFSAALDASGTVRSWGDNPGGVFGDDSYSPSSTPVTMPFPNVKAIAAGYAHLLLLRTDGTVWLTGFFMGASYGVPTQVAGLPADIRAIAAGHDGSFAVDNLGRLWAWGENANGELGAGDFQPRATPVQVPVPGGVSRVGVRYKTVLVVTLGGSVYGWGNVDTRNVLGVPSNSGDLVTSPQQVAGLSNIVDVAVGMDHFLARRADGVVMSWGPDFDAEALGRDVNAGTPPHVPSPVLELAGVTAIAAANSSSYALRADGSVWGWGVNWASGSGPTVGDGTFVRRLRPVVVIRENGAGNIDTNDWFLDAKPGTPKSIPAAKVPKLVSRATSLSSTGLLNVDGGVNVRTADRSKTVGLYVTGLVPVEFLAQANVAPGTQAKVARLGAKAGQLVLVNLTPAGWTIAGGQLQAFASGTGNAFLDAKGLLTNINPATIPGARFCIGYGETATDMLRTGTIADFLSLEGASSSALGLSCLLSGVYVDGPRSSPQGTAVPVRAVVVGQGPTGTLHFREGFNEISGDVAIASINPAVSDATFNYTPATAREYAFSALYSGDALNAVMASEVPLRHIVQPLLSSTSTRIEGPVTSEIGTEISITASVTGNRPGGTVQFKRGGVNEGAPVPVINDRAKLTVVGLGIGAHSFTAHYSGDGANQPSASSGFAHQVLDLASSAASLASAANPSVLGNAVSLTVTVSGTNPTGNVTLREGTTVLQARALASATATFTLGGVTPGVHVYSVDYAGDGNNPAATSNPVFQQVTLNIPANGDLDGDGIPNGVEINEGRDPAAKDNDIFASGRLFSMQQYRDFLAREGEAGGIAAWTAEITAGRMSRGQVIESFFNSPEFQGTISPVTRLYFAYFLRIPDYGGLSFWIGQFKGGTPLADISQAFSGSPEFTGRYGALDNGGFVDLVYNNVLGRGPDPSGRAYWKGELDAGRLTRGQVMLGFSESPEYQAGSLNRVYVTMMYVGMLRRAPDSGGFDFWVDYKNKGNSGLALIDGFLASPEYRGRFLP